MESKKRNEIVKLMTTTRNGEKREFVTSAIEIGKPLTFNKIGDTQAFNGNQWVPLEDKQGHRMSLGKVIFGRNIQFESNKIEDRIDAVIKAVESDKGLTLKPTKVEERELKDADGNVIMDAQGKPSMTKIYHFNKEMVG